MDILPASEVLEIRENSSNLQLVAQRYVVESDSLKAGEDYLREIKAIETKITARKEEITRPLMQGLTSIRDFFRPVEVSLADAKKTVKDKMLAYTIEVEEKAAKERERIAKRVEKGTMKQETALGKLVDLKANEVKSNTRTLKKLLISDESLLPREYLMPNREVITKALFAGVVVPGAELKEEKILVTPR